ncbi:MAG: serine hydrolase [Flavobacteriales bacterium]|nr:MAG: serine hydrolase [Flavobacteriales bacterium]
MRSPSLRSAFFLFIGLATSASAQTFQHRAQAVLDSVYRTDTTMVGLMLHVEAPDRGIAWSGASGRSAKGGEALHPEAPFLIASNIKTYVSATILRLVEEGKLTIDQPVGPLLTDRTRAFFASDGYDLQAITLTHLLTHTSGVDSYNLYGFMDSVMTRPYGIRGNRRASRSVRWGRSWRRTNPPLRVWPTAMGCYPKARPCGNGRAGYIRPRCRYSGCHGRPFPSPIHPFEGVRLHPRRGVLRHGMHAGPVAVVR